MVVVHRKISGCCLTKPLALSHIVEVERGDLYVHSTRMPLLFAFPLPLDSDLNDKNILSSTTTKREII